MSVNEDASHRQRLRLINDTDAESSEDAGEPEGCTDENHIYCLVRLGVKSAKSQTSFKEPCGQIKGNPSLSSQQRGYQVEWRLQ